MRKALLRNAGYDCSIYSWGGAVVLLCVDSREFEKVNT